MNKGDIVLFTCEEDIDKSEVPNVWPAIVTKVKVGAGWSGTDLLDICVIDSNGNFYKTDVPVGDPGSRNTWHPKP